MHTFFKALTLAVALFGLPAAASAATPATAPATAPVPASPFDKEIADAKGAMMADPEVALAHARAAGVIASAMPEGQERIVARATAQWLEAEALTRLNRAGEALPIVEQALTAVTAAAPGSKLNGDILMTRGQIAATTGRVQDALSDFQSAHNIFQAAGAKRSQAIALQNIGSLYNDAGDYERVLDYYEQSANVYGEDPALGISAHNNRGNAFKELGRYQEAEAEYRLALQLAQQLESPLLEARIMTNVASAEFLSGELDGAERTALEALKLAESGPAAAWAPFLWGVRAQIAFARGNLSTAAQFIDKTFAGADLTATTMYFRDFHKTAHGIFKARSQIAKALEHFEAYKRLDDEARAVKTSTNAALISAQFDFANQKVEIGALKAGQLQRDKEIAEERARHQTTLLLGVLAASTVIVTLAMFGFFSIRRSRNQTRAANVKLEDANAALAKALQARTEFLAMTSHEIRTPLNGILGMTQVLLQGSDLAAETREGIALVHGAGQTMKMLVDDLLDVAKMEAGRLVLEERVFALKPSLTEIAGLARGQCEAKGLRFVADIEACPERWNGDEQRLRQVVFNLVSNAVKFTEAGTVTLKASEEKTSAGRRFCLTVSDTGIGIPADHLARIFESFQQVDVSVTRRYGGTGLGLAICDNLVRAMGGTIAVESEPDVGSTFTVILPVPAGATDAAEAEASSATDNAVLLAETNLLRQSIIAAQLEVDGFEVTSADDGEAALLTAGARRFGRVVLSASALEAHTVEGLGRLKTMRAIQPNAQIIVLGAEEHRAAVQQCGADLILESTVPPTGISQAMRLSPTPAPAKATFPSANAA